MSRARAREKTGRLVESHRSKRRGNGKSRLQCGEAGRAAKMKSLIEGYRNYPGEHCGSVAMRGLLHHYCGLELPEHAVGHLKRVLNRACMLDAEGAMALETEATVRGFLHPETAGIIAELGKTG